MGLAASNRKKVRINHSYQMQGFTVSRCLRKATIIYSFEQLCKKEYPLTKFNYKETEKELTELQNNEVLKHSDKIAVLL